MAILYLGEYVPSPEFDNRINTLSNLRIELYASKHLVAGAEEHYFSVADEWLSLLQTQQNSIENRNELPEALRRVSGIGILATRFEAASEWDANAAVTATIAHDLTSQIPVEIREDSKADWSLWPGRQVPWTILNPDPKSK